jgi:hypothetical protein
VEGGVLFSIMAPTASRVELVGTFNEWNPKKSLLLKRNASGVWYIVADLPPGSHQYKYLIDGNWSADPGNPNRAWPNDDSIIEVPGMEPDYRPEFELDELYEMEELEEPAEPAEPEEPETEIGMI